MTVRIQVIKVLDIEVPEGTEDPIACVYGMSTEQIEVAGTLVDVMSDHAEITQ